MSAARPRAGGLAALPGLALAAAVGAAAWVAHGVLPSAVGAAVGAVVVAVALGLLVGNAVHLPTTVAPGLRAGVTRVLQVAIVLLGARLSFAQVAAVGGSALGLVVALMALALTLAWWLGRRLGVDPRLATLIGVGTSVCGNSAIVATAPVIGARDDEVSVAVATNTLFGTLAVFVYPLVASLAGFDAVTFGTWAGSAVNDTSQVVATGFAHSEAAGEIATTVKLTRNALMGAVIVVVALLHTGTAAGRRGASLATRLRQSFPPSWGSSRSPPCAASACSRRSAISSASTWSTC